MLSHLEDLFAHVERMRDSAKYNATADAACAAAITSFQGDISESSKLCKHMFVPLIIHVLSMRGVPPLTLAALAEKDVPQNHIIQHHAFTPLGFAILYGHTVEFLAAFTGYDVNCPCTRHGTTPLAELSTRHGSGASFQALFDAGAEFNDDMWGVSGRPMQPVCWKTNPELAALVSPHLRWSYNTYRHTWVRACLEPPGTSSCMLCDSRLRIYSDDATEPYRLISEYAAMVALFL